MAKRPLHEVSREVTRAPRNGVVWKFEFPVSGTGRDDVEVELPWGASVLHVGSQRPGHVCVWAAVDPGMPTYTRTFHVRGTGVPLGAELGEPAANYRGTVVDGRLVWHVFG